MRDEGTRRAGLHAVAVRTGKLRDASPERTAEADVVLGSIAELPSWLGL